MQFLIDYWYLIIVIPLVVWQSYRILSGQERSD